MLGSRLDEIRELKQQVIAARNAQDYEWALELADEAVDELDGLRERQDLDEAEYRAVQAELADTFGLKGGIFRRMTDDPEHLGRALAEYRKGRDIERDDNQSTYNASNAITLAITHERKSPRDISIDRDLNRVIDHLEEETARSRSDEWWAWSDLAQFHLLRNEPEKAREAYRRALRTGPTSQEFRRHLDILKELQAATNECAEDRDIAKAIEDVMREVERSRS